MVWAVLGVIGLALMLLAGLLFSTLRLWIDWEKENFEGDVELGLFRGKIGISFALKKEEAWRICLKSGPWKKSWKVSVLFQKLRKRKKKRKRKSAGKWLTKMILRAIRLRQWKLDCRIGLPDAAQCALLCGSIEGTLEALLASVPLEKKCVIQNRVAPCFNCWEFALHLEGMILFHPVQSILANRKYAKDGEEYVVSASH